MSNFVTHFHAWEVSKNSFPEDYQAHPLFISECLLQCQNVDLSCEFSLSGTEKSQIHELFDNGLREWVVNFFSKFSFTLLMKGHPK